MTFNIIWTVQRNSKIAISFYFKIYQYLIVWLLILVKEQLLFLKVIQWRSQVGLSHFAIMLISKLFLSSINPFKGGTLWKFHWSLSSRFENIKIFSVNINYFHQFFGFSDTSLLQRNEWLQHIINDLSIFYFQPSLNRLFNNVKKLYWCYTSSSWNMTHPEKATLTKPSLIRVKNFLVNESSSEVYWKHVQISLEGYKSKIYFLFGEKEWLLCEL